MNQTKKRNKQIRERAELLHKGQAGYSLSSNIYFLIYIVVVIICAFAIRSFLFSPIRVEGTSMQNTLQHNERMIVEKVSYWFTEPKQGDIVIVHFPNKGAITYVKRIVAVAGQTIEIKSNDEGYYVEIDGERLDESAYEGTMLIDDFRVYPRIQYGDNGRYTVPEGYVFVMGDHRTNSKDSRFAEVGAIPLYDVIGRVHGVIYPFDAVRPVD